MDFDAAADELFALTPAAFIERRNSLAEVARSDGDAELAGKIKALRRPTVGAALVNALVRERGEVIASFLALGDDLRDAQARGDGQQMRALAGRRQELMRGVDRDVAELASARGLSATRAVQQDIHATLLAALSDPRAAEVVRRGRLESALTNGMFADSAPAATRRPTSATDSDAESAERKRIETNANAAAADDAVNKLAEALTTAQREVAELAIRLEEALEQARRIEQDKSTADRKLAAAQDAHADAVQRAKALHEAAAHADLRAHDH